MATWLTYLRIAKRIKDRISGIDLSYLMLGMIAPFVDTDMDEELSIDSIISQNLDIMNNRVSIDQRIIAFKSKYINPPLILYKSDMKRSFLWGYYFGLLVSRLWRDALPENYNVEEFIRFHNKYDFEYIINVDSEIISYFDSSQISLNKFDDFDMFNLLQMKNRIVKYYSTDMGNIEIETGSNFDREWIESFIERASRICSNVLLGKVSII